MRFSYARWRGISALVFVLIFSFSNLYSQNLKIEGTVKDSANAPLEMANVVLLNATDNSMSGYAFTDDKGRFQLKAEAEKEYVLRVSFLGFKPQDIPLDGRGKTEVFKEIKLEAENSVLNEVQVVEEMPIVISGDTIIYQAEAFTDGEERKLEDVLEKLPGFEVDDDGNVKVQGKNVEKVMVEGKDFFDGDTKLATKNIPANAVDKVQVLRNYNDVGPMQGVDNDDRIVLNIKLKDGKKSIVFGDISAEAGLDERYLIHPNIFWYTPKTSINFIGDLNNLGEPAFTYRDYFRFSGGFRGLSQRRGSVLRVADDFAGNFITNNRANEITTQLGAANVTWNPNKKWAVSGFALVSGNNTSASNQTNRTYIRDDQVGREEILTTNSEQENFSGMGKMKATYTPNQALHISYNGLLKISDSRDFSNRSSDFGIFTNQIISDETQRPWDLTQSLGAFWEINSNNISSLEVQHLYKLQDPSLNLNTSQRPFPGILPLTDSSDVQLFQSQLVETQKTDANLNHYFILNKTNHINFVIGGSFSHQNYTSEMGEILGENQENSFTGDSLSNDLDFRLTDIFGGVRYKTKIKKLTLSPGLNLHHYSYEGQPVATENFSLEKTLLLPDFFARYDFKSSQSLTLNYQMQANFMDVDDYLPGLIITSYNSLFVGNPELQNALAHNVNLNFYSFNMFNFTNIFAGVNYSRTIDALVRGTDYRFVERVNTPLNADGTNDVLSAYGNYGKRFWKLRARVGGNWSISNTNNRINGIENQNSSFTQTYSLSLETNFKKAPNVELAYRYINNDYQGATISNAFETHAPSIEVEAVFLKSFTFVADYAYNHYSRVGGGLENIYDFLNAKLFFQKEDSPWEFKIEARNLLNTDIIRQDSFSDNLISTTQYFVLPRYLTAGVKYDL